MLGEKNQKRYIFSARLKGSTVGERQIDRGRLFQSSEPKRLNREDAYSRTAYFIRHTALSCTYAIVAYIRHNNNAGYPVFGIPGLLHWPESSQLQMKLQYAWNQRTTHQFLWFKTHGCEWLGDINVCKLLYYQEQGLAYWHGWTNHTTTLFIMALL